MRRGGEPPLGRLRKRQDFRSAAAGRRFHTERMTVQGRPREASPGEGLRVGFTVTKRVGHATERNRMRRRLRRAALEAGGAHREASVDVVVIARRECLGAEYSALVEDIARALAVVTRPKPGRPPNPIRPETGDQSRGTSHA